MVQRSASHLLIILAYDLTLFFPVARFGDYFILQLFHVLMTIVGDVGNIITLSWRIHRGTLKVAVIKQFNILQ